MFTKLTNYLQNLRYQHAKLALTKRLQHQLLQLNFLRTPTEPFAEEANRRAAVVQHELDRLS